MKYPLFFFACFLSTNLFAQKVVIKNADRELNLKEEYEVLASDNNIKDGKYTSWGYFDGDLVKTGFYKNNQKDSLWKYYSFKNYLLDSGYYKNNQKVGIWVASREDTRPLVKYDYTTKNLLYYRSNPKDSARLYEVVIDGKPKLSKLERPPIYLDGERMFNTIIARNITIPREAREAGAKGSVIVFFTIDEDGQTSNYHVRKKSGYGFDQEAIKTVKKADGAWLPAILNGKPVASNYEMLVIFDLQ